MYGEGEGTLWQSLLVAQNSVLFSQDTHLDCISQPVLKLGVTMGLVQTNRM